MLPWRRRSKEERRPSRTSLDTTDTAAYTTDTTSTLIPDPALPSQTPFRLLISTQSNGEQLFSRSSTGETLYRVRDTGRKSLSKKPDYEIFRASAGDLLVGSIRIGMRGIEVKFPLTGASSEDIENVDMAGRKCKWEATHIGKGWNHKMKEPDGSRGNIVVLHCCDEQMGTGVEAEDGLIASVKLLDIIPNGSVEVWDRRAWVDEGGDWGVLDEVVVFAVANMERARRKALARGPDTSGPGYMGMGMALAMGPGVGGGGGF